MAAPATTEAKRTPPARSADRRLRFRDPFDLFEDLQEELARIWGQRPPMFPSISRPRGRPFVSIATFAPRVDVYEANGDLVVKAEIPGVKKDEVKITLDEGDLVLEGERKAETEVKEENYYRLERAYGSFYRRIPVPFEVKAEKVKTRFADGVLEVRIPMPAEAKPQSQSIPIG